MALKQYKRLFEFENAKGIITSVGGQTANNLTPKLAKNGIKMMGINQNLSSWRKSKNSLFLSVIQNLKHLNAISFN